MLRCLSCDLPLQQQLPFAPDLGCDFGDLAVGHIGQAGEDILRPAAFDRARHGQMELPVLAKCFPIF